MLIIEKTSIITPVAITRLKMTDKMTNNNDPLFFMIIPSFQGYVVFSYIKTSINRISHYTYKSKKNPQKLVANPCFLCYYLNVVKNHVCPFLTGALGYVKETSCLILRNRMLGSPRRHTEVKPNGGNKMSVISMKQLLEAGVHFGHQTRRWNPKMAPYIFTERNGIHIIDLQKSVGKVDEAYNAVSDIVAQGGIILFVGTKKQAQDAVKTEAERCGMFYVNERWLGGMLTNFKTIQSRIARLKAIEKMSEDGTFDVLPKKEVIELKKEWDKLEKNLGGIKEMKRIPDAIFVVDPKKEHICVTEAHALGITLIGIGDTNCDPEELDFIIPGNDDAIRAVKLIVSKMADAVIEANQGETAMVDAEDANADAEVEATDIEEVAEEA